MIPWRRKRKYRVYRTETVYFPVNGITRSFGLKKQRVCDVWAKTAREAIRESQIRYVYLLCYRPDIRVTGIDPDDVGYKARWTAEIVRRK